MNSPIYIPMTVTVDAVTIPLSLSVDQVELPVTIAAGMAASTCPEFAGPYEYTPTESPQTILINDMRATQDIVVNAIPSNWGRITWNGSVLTVS